MATRIILPIRVLISSMTMICFVMIPRILIYFGLDLGTLNDLVSPWGTFLLIMGAGFFIMFPWLKNWRLSVFALLGLVAGAVFLTFYLCQL